jgi:hypothetical protein
VRIDQVAGQVSASGVTRHRFGTTSRERRLPGQVNWHRLQVEYAPRRDQDGHTVARLLSGFDNKEYRMAQKVADVMWEMLAKAGVKRCYCTDPTC